MFTDGTAKQQEGRRGALSVDNQRAGIELLIAKVKDPNTANLRLAQGRGGVDVEDTTLDGADAEERTRVDRGPVAEGVVDRKSDKAYVVL